MKKLIIFSLFVHSCIFINAQLKQIFYDDFSSNQNKWMQGQANGSSAQVKDGKYVIELVGEQTLNPQVVCGIDSTKDYSISVRFSQTKSQNPNTGAGLIFGSNLARFHCVWVSEDGKATVAEVENNKFLPSDAIIFSGGKFNKGAGNINTIRIVKSVGKLKYYLNDSMVALSPSKKLNGLYVGFVVLPGGTYEFDDLTISGTPVVTSGGLCELFPLIYESSKEKFSYIMGMKTAKNQFASLNMNMPENVMTLDIDNNTSTLDFPIKKFANIDEATRGRKELIAELQKCLPAFQVVEEKNSSGITQYAIKKKNEPLAVPPKSVIELTNGPGEVYMYMIMVAVRQF